MITLGKQTMQLHAITDTWPLALNEPRRCRTRLEQQRLRCFGVRDVGSIVFGIRLELRVRLDQSYFSCGCVSGQQQRMGLTY